VLCQLWVLLVLLLLLLLLLLRRLRPSWCFVKLVSRQLWLLLLLPVRQRCRLQLVLLPLLLGQGPLKHLQLPPLPWRQRHLLLLVLLLPLVARRHLTHRVSLLVQPPLRLLLLLL
jgi:hypothetical protein